MLPCTIVTYGMLDSQWGLLKVFLEHVDAAAAYTTEQPLLVNA